MKSAFIIVVISATIFSCTSSRVVKPLGEGEKETGISLGGPLINFSSYVIPIPFTSIHYAQGVNEGLTALGALHTTSLLSGVVHAEAGVLQNLVSEDEFFVGISLCPSLHFMIDIWEWNPKLFPALDVNFYHSYNDKGSYFYFGISNWFDLSKYKAHNELNNTKWLFAPFAGHTYVGEKWDINIELKYLTPNISNDNVVVDYVKWFGSKGAPGLYLGFNYKF